MKQFVLLFTPAHWELDCPVCLADMHHRLCPNRCLTQPIQNHDQWGSLYDAAHPEEGAATFSQGPGDQFPFPPDPVKSQHQIGSALTLRHPCLRQLGNITLSFQHPIYKPTPYQANLTTIFRGSSHARFPLSPLPSLDPPSHRRLILAPSPFFPRSSSLSVLILFSTP
jgi:hypothetical protein